MNKKGGAINRAEFINALKEAQMYNKPISEKGEALHSLSTDAEYEAYFNPMMQAHSKWLIEYNVA